MNNHHNIILIGLDGVGVGEIGGWLEDGSLAELNRIKNRGCLTKLQSTHPPWTPCAWPSLLSGRNPGKHGVFDFFTRKGYDKQLVDRSEVDAPYLFEVADSQDLTPIAINYPLTHPAPELEHGAIVPGYLAPEDVTFHPESLRAEYEREHGEYVIYPEYGTDDEPVETYVDVARGRRDMARFLHQRYDWDLLAVQFQVTDSIFHDLDDRKDIHEVLVHVDSFVGDIIDLGRDDPAVYITSDHGMGDYNWTFYINSWLAEQGYCETTTGDAQYFRQQKDVLKGPDSESESESSIESVVTRIANAFSSVGMSPQRLHRVLSTIGLAGYIERVLPEEALLAAQNQVVDHANSAAFLLYFNSLGIHLNVEQRDPDGVVPEANYEKVRSELIEQLVRIRDPDGNPVFDSVLPREEVYSGDHLEDAPDILLVPMDYRYDVSGSILDIFRRFSHKNHRPEGLLLSNRQLGDVEEAKIYDIAPTVASPSSWVPSDSASTTSAE